MASNPKDLIINLPNPHLRQRSQRVGFISQEVTNLVKTMQNATLDWEDSRKHEVGVALAAVQIDQLLRVVIIREDFEDKNNRNFKVLINPELVKAEGELVEDFEGCLSIKDIYGKVPRYAKVKVKAMDLNGREFRITAEGFLARVLQHEIDHTNGKVFIDHIKDDPAAFYRLDDSGKLEEIDYEQEIRTSNILW
jgi:peptide deformylase